METKRLQAYELMQEQELKGIQSKGYLLRHKKSGARIVLIENEDENKVFSVGFRTPPQDSTGLPHILEHSVLCGSREFPAKDPFVELVKGSLNTFLNAMTYPDKTVYPVASCNDPMGQIPESMIEAAKLDGASHLRVCWQIVMPNVKPAWLTLMIFAFQGAWQITGYLFVYSEQLKPIPIVMQQIAAAGIARQGVSSATVVVLMLPPMILFLILQSNVVETMAHSGLKD